MSYSLDTYDGYIRRMIAVGRRMGISPRGIVIGISVGLVESNFRVYSNPAVPESMKLPHDAVGYDGKSVGVMQQQVVSTSNGWWWGSAEECMNPERSFEMFFARLKSRDYNSGDPGSHAQGVQGSAYPTRYGQRMAEAQKLYDRLSGGSPVAYFDTDRSSEFDFGYGRSTSAIRGICFHTTEGVTSANATADTDNNVTTYQCTSQTGSYHVMVGVDGERIRQNTDDWVTWSSGNKGNDILLHICLVGSASQSRAEWLAEDKMLRAAASVVRYWSDQYSIPLKKVSAAGLPGLLGHVDTQVWGGTDHTDPGAGFPYDRIIELAKGSATTTKPETGGLTMDASTELTKKFPSRSMFRHSDALVDTLAGFVLNIDARLHEQYIFEMAGAGDAVALDLVRREAAKGEPRCIALLNRIGASK